MCTIGNVDSHNIAAIEHHLLQHAVFAVSFAGKYVECRDAVARERLLHEHRPACRLLQWHPRTTERPARARCHINFYAVAAALVLHKPQHLHISVGEERDVVRVVALHAVDGRDFHRTDTGTAILLQIPLQILLVYGRAQPPPAHTWSRFWFRFRPLLSMHRKANCRQQEKGCNSSHIINAAELRIKCCVCVSFLPILLPPR